MGFFAFIMTLVIGILVVAGGLRWLWGSRAEPLPRPVEAAAAGLLNRRHGGISR